MLVGGNQSAEAISWRRRRRRRRRPVFFGGYTQNTALRIVFLKGVASLLQTCFEGPATGTTTTTTTQTIKRQQYSV
jgi:hypothetical protein